MTQVLNERQQRVKAELTAQADAQGYVSAQTAASFNTLTLRALEQRGHLRWSEDGGVQLLEMTSFGSLGAQADPETGRASSDHASQAPASPSPQQSAAKRQPGAHLDPERRKAVEAAMQQVHKAYGKGALMWLGERQVEDVEAISTGSIKLDQALGVGGLPRGRVVEIYGPESSGKTTLALHAIAQCQRDEGGTAAFIDAEHALDPDYAENLGVDVDSLLLSQPDTGEQALEIADRLVRSGAVDLIVMDSVAALTPKAEIEGEMGDSHVGLQARLMSQALRKLSGNISRTQGTLIFINQLRMKIGVSFGSPETTSGGNALKFYSSVRLDVRRTGSVKSGDEITGNETRVKVVKNKVAPPFRQADFQITYGEGIDWRAEVIDLAIERGLLQKNGAWYALDGRNVAQGARQMKAYLVENPEIADWLLAQLQQPRNALDHANELSSGRDA